MMAWDTYKKCSRCGEIFPVPDNYEKSQVLRCSMPDYRPGAFNKYYQYDWMHVCPICMISFTMLIDNFFKKEISNE